MLNFIKRHWSAVIAFLCIWIAPLLILLIQGITLANNGFWYQWKLECWSMFALAIVLIVYFKKGKKKLDQKLFASEIKGKAKNPLWVLANALLSIFVFLFIWLVSKTIVAFGLTVEKYCFIVLIFEIVGQIFNFIHSISEKKREG